MRPETQEKLNRMGINIEDLRQKVQQYVGAGKAFGTPQEYAAEIQRKQAQGTPFTDLETAQQFRQVSPHLFGKPVAPEGQTHISLPTGAVPAKTGSAEADAILSAIYGAQNQPFAVPYPPGTPTQARRQAEEQKRQFDVEQAFQEREFEADEANRQAQLALQRAAQAASASNRTLTERTRTSLAEAMLGVDYAIQNNPAITLNQLIDNINKQQAELTYEGVDPQALRDYAMQKYYQYHYSKALQATQGGPRWDYGQDIRNIPWLEEKYGPSAYTKPPAQQDSITRAEAERYAADSGNMFTAEQIMDFDRRGMLEWALKEIYGDYTGAGGESDAIRRMYP